MPCAGVNTAIRLPYLDCMPIPRGRLWLRSMQPGAQFVSVIDPDDGKVLIELAQRKIDVLGDASGFFEGSFLGHNTPFNYRPRIVWPGGVQEIDDPYRFPTVLW